MTTLLNITGQHRWLITGAAGFIGSHLVEELLKADQYVVGLDNLSSAGSSNIKILEDSLPSDKFKNFTLYEGDIRNNEICSKACTNIDFVLHQAAIGSVPRSFDEVTYVDSVNVGGFLNILESAQNNNVKKLIYASSSAVYGDYTDKPNKEDQPLKPQSPYAISKYTNELYAQALSRHYNLPCIGLRYFNVYGPRQDPNGAYAAVIPKWIELMKLEKPIEIYGDGAAVRDFCFVKDVVRANITAAFSQQNIMHDIYNVGSGKQTSLNMLFEVLQKETGYMKVPLYKNKRVGDIHTSYANINKIQKELNFLIKYHLKQNTIKTILQ